MKKKIVLLVTALVLFSCSKQENSKNIGEDQQVNFKNQIVVTATGYGENEKVAISDAVHEAKMIGFGNILNLQENPQNISCIKDSLLTKDIDDVGMWTVKIQATLVRNKDDK